MLFSRTTALILALLLMVSTVALGQQAYELEDEGFEPVADQAEAAPDTPEYALQRMRERLAAEDFREARRLADEWIRQNPEHPQRDQARLVRGDALVGLDRSYRALYDYEYIVRVMPESPLYMPVLEREYEIAERFLEGERRRLLGLRVLPTRSEGEELMIRIQERAPGSRLGERASLRLADHYFNRGEYVDAAEAYDLFLMNYPRSAQAERAKRQVILANLRSFRGLDFDPSGLIEARTRLEGYQQQFPGAEELDVDETTARIDEDLAAKQFNTARWYERRGERVSAAYSYQRLIEEYPQTDHAERARERLGRMNLPFLSEDQESTWP